MPCNESMIVGEPLAGNGYIYLSHQNISDIGALKTGAPGGLVAFLASLYSTAGAGLIALLSTVIGVYWGWILYQDTGCGVVIQVLDTGGVGVDLSDVSIHNQEEFF